MSGIVGGAGAKSGVVGTTEIDYEEGTWNPVVKDTSGNAFTMHGSYNTCSYTKIGRTVTCVGEFDTTSAGSANGDIRVHGFPFTNGPTAQLHLASFNVGYGGGFNFSTAGFSPGGYMSANLTYVTLRLWDSTSSATPMHSSEWSDDGFVVFHITYFVS